MRAPVQCKVYMDKNPQRNYEDELLLSILPCTLKGHKTLLNLGDTKKEQEINIFISLAVVFFLKPRN